MAEVASPSRPQDWSLQDREDFTTSWNRANVINLLRGAAGSEEYATIRQRTAFYGWFDQIREAQKHEVLWPACAWIVAGQMSSLENGLRTFGMTVRRVAILEFRTSQRLIDFGKAGNKAIFDNVFPSLKTLFERGLQNKPLVKNEAAEWDRTTLHTEQFEVVQPIYQRFAGGDKDMQDELKSLASGHDIFWMGGVAIGHSLDFEGDIMNASDRFRHGSIKVPAFYRRFKQAIDEMRADSQAAGADPAAGGVVRAG